MSIKTGVVPIPAIEPAAEKKYSIMTTKSPGHMLAFINATSNESVRDENLTAYLS